MANILGREVADPNVPLEPEEKPSKPSNSMKVREFDSETLIAKIRVKSLLWATAPSTAVCTRVRESPEPF